MRSDQSKYLRQGCLRLAPREERMNIDERLDCLTERHEALTGFNSTQSHLSAVIGSIFAARRAGIQQAISTITIITTGTIRSVAALLELRP